LFELIFFKEAPKLTKETMILLQKIGNWYVDENSTYIKVYGATKPPHFLPKFIPNRFIIREITYQTILNFFNVALSKAHKTYFPSYPIYIGMYGLRSYNFMIWKPFPFRYIILENGGSKGITLSK
jgi:hypothetical protein